MNNLYNTNANKEKDDLISSLKELKLKGYFDFENISNVAFDFGNTYHLQPMAVLYPKTVNDISTTIKHVFKNGNVYPQLTITARGHAHSLQAQSQNQGGIVISMESLEEAEVYVESEKQPCYADVSGGELWIKLLRETLKYGLTPKSWTDYLNLTVGGTLSNAGISGEAFKHGPQIHTSNVLQLQVVTGKGDIVNCSEQQNSDLFYGVLGGLGQFGIITKARISLQPAPKLVKWIRVVYSEFNLLTKDQEYLILSSNDSFSFDYIEGFVLTNIVNNWTSTFITKQQLRVIQSVSQGKLLYFLELAKFFNPQDQTLVNRKTEKMLSKLKYIPHTLMESEVGYVDFLDRIHPSSEFRLEVIEYPNISFPWINLLIPKSKIHLFGAEVFGHILANISYNPILIYPFNQSRWKDKTSVVTPEEEVIYLAAFVSQAKINSSGMDGLENMLAVNQRILEFTEKAELGVKQYLPFHETQDAWRAHFGKRWKLFAQRKLAYDPLSILAPKQRIFPRGQPILL
ncbi:cytokinin dehydrogenase 1-like [Amaranthus tricolor]|uniref:cytokinin dehydrogenase 1-like n=1 Tax=Amaranthus tricolor TaxID=29722 RepID=UPI00258DF0A1|nr:cytokinin dehydrogenase 1-like [Amaranthus tricolor]